MKKIIKRALCKRIAFCRRGKNGMGTLLQSEGAEPALELQPLVQANMAEGRLLAVVAAPGLTASDGFEFKDIDVVRQMAHSFVGDGGLELDIEHDGKVLPRTAARLVESFMIQPNDARFEAWPLYNGDTVNLCQSGGWATEYQIDDPGLRAAYERGDWDGVSLFGLAAVEQSDDVMAASQRVAERLGQEKRMTQEELAALLKAQGEQTATLIQSALAPLIEALSPKAEKQESEGEEPVTQSERPTFTGRADSPEDLRAFQAELQAWEINQSLASGKLSAKDVEAMVQSLTSEGPTDAEIGAEAGDTPEMTKLRRELFELKRSQSAPTNAAPREQVESLEMSDDERKEMTELIQANLGGAPVPATGFRLVPRA